MTHTRGSSDFLTSFGAHLQKSLAAQPCHYDKVALSRSPAVVDVMGGIAEDSGSLVLTTTLAHTFFVAVWHTDADSVSFRFVTNDSNAPERQFAIPRQVFGSQETTPGDLVQQFQEADAQWAAPSGLAIHQAMIDAAIPNLPNGLSILIGTDFPVDADLGREVVQASATVDALCKLFQATADPFMRSRISAIAAFPLTGMLSQRTAMTAICGTGDGALLQLRFQPQPMCDKLELPAGVTITTARTKLGRPTSRQRLVETRICAEMGRRLISDLQRRDGLQVDSNGRRLGAITPAEYVDRYRDRLPPKMSGKLFSERFGDLRGLDEGVGDTNTYKVRSRAEHHIYENRRVHEFATSLVRAKRNNDVQSLIRAGELMYASHWSHSQRCGIGGVETDRLATHIRKHGPQAGLYGAKVTAGGAGGEVVVLMRDDETAHQALKAAIAAAEAESNEKIHTFHGSLPGSHFFQSEELGSFIPVADSASTPSTNTA